MSVALTKAHADLGASSADRWMNCPGSVRMTADLPNVSTVYTEEGTAAHALAERCLQKGIDADALIGVTIDGYEVTDEMAEAVQVYLDVVRGIPHTQRWIERRFTLEHLNPPGPMFGTADCVLWDASSKILTVVDYKHGQGYAVPVVGNPQLRYYALGAVLSLEGEQVVPEHVEIIVVQPRAIHPDGIVRREVLEFADVVEFMGDLLDRARRTNEPNAPLVPGGWCRFCRASAICPAQVAAAQAVAQVEFTAVDITPPAPATLPDDVLARVLEHSDVLEKWLKSVKSFVQARLETGGEFPGYKLVRGRTNRAWADETEAAQWAAQESDDLFVRKLKSPAQAEKLLGKGSVPAHLITKPEGKLTLAPVQDPRPAVEVTPGAEFTALPAGDAA